jgi:hypothetical protein
MATLTAPRAPVALHRRTPRTWSRAWLKATLTLAIGVPEPYSAP